MSSPQEKDDNPPVHDLERVETEDRPLSVEDQAVREQENQQDTSNIEDETVNDDGHAEETEQQQQQQQQESKDDTTPHESAHVTSEDSAAPTRQSMPAAASVSSVAIESIRDEDNDDDDDDEDDEFDQIMKEMAPTGARPLSMGVRKSARLQQEKRKSSSPSPSVQKEKASFVEVSLEEKGQSAGDVDAVFEDEKPLTIAQRLSKLLTSPTVVISSVVMVLLTVAVVLLVAGIIITLAILHGSNIMFVCGGLEFSIMIVLSAISLIGLLPVLMLLFSKIKSKYDDIFNEDENLPMGDEPTKMQRVVSVAQNTLLTTGKFAIILVGFIALALLVALFIFAVTYRQLYVSPLSGQITVPKVAVSADILADAGPDLGQEAKIYRESNGIVHIVAKNDLDMFYSQGFATAQDRLWQLDFNRRLASGTVAELLGEAWLPWDKLRRTIGLNRAADATYDVLPADTQQILQAYCNGINAFIEFDKSNPTTSKNRVPELIAYPDYTFQKWRPQDLVLLHKELAFTMSRNMDHEIRRLIALGRDTSIERINELMPDYPENATTILSHEDAGIPPGMTQEDIDLLYAQQTNETGAYIPPTTTISQTKTSTVLERVMGTSSEDMVSRIDSRMVDMMLFRSSCKFPPNSNAWAVSGKYTASGKPILANDPHTALEAPSTWHMVHLTSDNTDAIGLAIPGIPGIFIGRNKHIAWGFSNLVADTMDLFATPVNSDKSKYVHDGIEKEFVSREEKIKVKIGGAISEVSYTVKETLYGPVVNDVIDALSGLDILPLSLKWTGFDAAADKSLVALTTHFKTSTWTDFSATMENLAVPAVSVVFADSENIAYMAVGIVPTRKEGHSGRFVVDGDGSWDHTGVVPSGQMPRKLNPSSGYVIAANHLPVPRGFEHRICNDVSPHFRAERIEDMLLDRINATSDKLTRQDMKLIQNDINSKLFHTLRFVFDQIDPEQLTTTQQRSYRDKMVNWDGVMEVDSVEATFFEKWYMEMDALSTDELGPFHPDLSYYLLNILHNDTVNTDPACLKWGTCQEAAKAIFNETVAYMLAQNDPRWAKDVHHVEYTHAALENRWCRCLGLRSTFVPGGTETVNFSPITNTRSFASMFGPSARMIVEMLPHDQLTKDKSPDLFITAVGQSGNLFESSYSNMMLAFHDGEYRKMILNFNGDKQSRFVQKVSPPS